MASSSYCLSIHLLLFSVLISACSASHPARMLFLVKPKPIILKYHGGDLLKGNITVNLLWYGKFNPSEKSIIIDFLNSLSTNNSIPPPPSAAYWWNTTASYNIGQSKISVGSQISDQNYSIGKSLTDSDITSLASKLASPGPGKNLNSFHLVLTSTDVLVDGFCMSRCGVHGSGRVKRRHGHRLEFAYGWVGNPTIQCPGECAWPFHKPTVGPQTPPLTPPNGDVGVDGMVISLATILAGAVTNPFDKGYFQGSPSMPMEAVTACAGLFGSGAFPGYPGKLLVDKKTGASYNALGVKGRKYLIPAIWDPNTLKCKTLV
ncbi:protein EXORDIUM-like 2 [Impatiens glandulifera]|uniref:protein EXORDIUM-like 2 n=1 Tax=Impatiens glandulifera TaxID=253017 RepID=UPI001FB169AA|nr:protein EXORDIUM-like 2 [Impatiens glandulifera]